jgi:hypothetical protein
LTKSNDKKSNALSAVEGQQSSKPSCPVTKVCFINMKLITPHDENTLYCFSPPVMLLTFIIEFALAIYILFTAKLKASSTLIILILIVLGIFQLAEYQVCSNRSLIWMKMGYVAITLLPSLGMHLINLIIKKSWYNYVSYGLATLFIGAFLISTMSIQTAVCGGNYIMTTINKNVLSHYFTYYYYLMLLFGLIISFRFMNSQKKDPTGKLETNYLAWIAFGYASFMIPTATVYFLSQSARSGIPSIMCGFAIFLAIILVLKVYPISRKLDI